MNKEELNGYNEMMVNRTEDRKLEPYDNPAYCSWCGRLLKPNEKYYKIGMDIVCTDCIEECAWYV